MRVCNKVRIVKQSVICWTLWTAPLPSLSSQVLYTRIRRAYTILMIRAPGATYGVTIGRFLWNSWFRSGRPSTGIYSS